MAIWLYACLTVCLGVKVRGKVCRLRLLWLPVACESALSLWQRGSGSWPPVTISVNTASKHTLCCTRQPGTLTASQVFNTISSNIVWTENKKEQVSGQRLLLLFKVEQDGWGFCVLCGRDWLSTVKPSYSSSSNKASTEEKTLCHLLCEPCPHRHLKFIKTTWTLNGLELCRLFKCLVMFMIWIMIVVRKLPTFASLFHMVWLQEFWRMCLALLLTHVSDNTTSS